MIPCTHFTLKRWGLRTRCGIEWLCASLHIYSSVFSVSSLLSSLCLSMIVSLNLFLSLLMMISIFSVWATFLQVSQFDPPPLYIYTNKRYIWWIMIVLNFELEFHQSHLSSFPLFETFFFYLLWKHSNMFSMNCHLKLCCLSSLCPYTFFIFPLQLSFISIWFSCIS